MTHSKSALADRSPSPPRPAPALVAPAVESGTAAAVRELLARLGELHVALKELTELATEKLAALRQADTAALERCAAREGALLTQMYREEPGRRATLARLAQSLRLAQPGPPRLERMAALLPEPLGSAVRARAAGLAELATELQQKNRLAATVARNLQSHLRGLFAELAGPEPQSRGYGPQGRETAGRPRTWVNAIG